MAPSGNIQFAHSRPVQRGTPRSSAVLPRYRSDQAPHLRASEGQAKTASESAHRTLPAGLFYIVALFSGLVAAFIFVGVVSAQEIDKERAISIVQTQGGPGGCADEASCSDFCDNSDNYQICIDWARQNGLMSEEKAEKAKKLAEQARDFSGPGGCSTPEACRSFCESPDNHETCIDFAVNQGFMSREDAERIRGFREEAEKFRERAERERERFEQELEIDPEFDKDKAMQIVETQGGPGGCRSFEECEDFCEQEQNQQTCFEFAEEHGLFKNSEHAQKIKKVLTEGGPGGCRGESQCRQFCENPDNFEVCIDFAEKNQFIPPEQVEKAKRGIRALKEGGPGGCRSPKECEEVCRKPENQEACFEWAKKHNLISEQELERIEEFKKRGEELRREFEQRGEEFEKRTREQYRPPEGFQPPGESGQFPVPPEFEAARKCSENGGFWTGSACEFRKEGEYRQEGEYKPPAEFTPPPGYDYPQYTKQPEYSPQYTPPPEYSPIPDSSPTYYQEGQYPQYHEGENKPIIQETGSYILNSFKEFLR